VDGMHEVQRAARAYGFLGGEREGRPDLLGSDAHDDPVLHDTLLDVDGRVGRAGRSGAPSTLLPVPGAA
jgi:hypothetical protein